MDYTTIAKTVETTFKNYIDTFLTKEVKDSQKKSQEFALAVLDAQTKATLTGIEALGKLAGSESTTYLLEVTKSVETAYDNAKEIIKNGTSNC